MKTLAFFLGKGSVIVVFKKRVDTSEKFLSQLFNFGSHCCHINTAISQLLPNYFQASLSSFTKYLRTTLEIWMIFIERVVGKMDVGITEVLFSRFLVVLNTESGQSFFI